MARFFQNLDDEKKQIKKKTAAIAEDADARTSKRDKKLKELEKKARDVMEAERNFDKLAKKFVADLKKFTKLFEDGELPGCLRDLFMDRRVHQSGQLRSYAMDFLRQFPGDRNAIFGEPGTAVSGEAARVEENVNGPVVARAGRKAAERNTLEHILDMASEEEKETALLSYAQNDISEDEQCAIAIVLFSIYFRRSSADRMIWVLERFAESLKADNAYSRIFTKGLDSYISKIYSCLEHADFDRYLRMLDLLSCFGPEVVESRKLEFNFFKLSLNPENEHPQFKFLHLIRNKNWERALGHYESHKTGGTSATPAYLNILTEFADLATENGEFPVAFEALAFCRENGMAGLLHRIYALCIVLNLSIRDDPVFVSFLNDFKNFDTNILVLRSQDPLDEIFRAFYLFNMYDHASAGRIIGDVCGFECTEALRNGVLAIIEDGCSVADCN